MISVRAALAACRRGDSKWDWRRSPARPMVSSAGNIACFSGHLTGRTWVFVTGGAQAGMRDAVAEAVTETLPWPLPESALRQAARSMVARAHPQVRQHIGAISRRRAAPFFTAGSRGKAQAARSAAAPAGGGS